jgi:uncharacterized protein YggU (UPF0235/DUF167 family)
MKIFVKAKTGAKEEKVKKIKSEDKRKGDYLLISVKERQIKGAANKAIIKTLSKYLDIPSSKIKNISGPTSKWKVFEHESRTK